MKCRDMMRSQRGTFVIFLWVLTALLAINGAALGASGESSASGGTKRITNIKTVEHPNTIDVLIGGNQPLTYTTVKQSSPPALLLYFSNTSLQTSQNVFIPANPILHSINASEISRNGQTTKLQILLKDNAPYQVTREENGVRISFGSGSRTLHAPTQASESMPSNEAYRTPNAPPPAAPENVPPAAGNGSFHTASRLQSVYAAKFGDSLKVFVGADGMITNYRSFTIDRPARIVFDIFNIQSPYEGEKVIPVNTRWVSQIRYHSYPDRVRVVLDTQSTYLDHFSAHPVENGLLIHMGSGIARQAEKVHTSPAPRASSYTPSMRSASRVQSVYATQLDDSMLVNVRGDGPINEFQTSTADNPPRIIVDMYGVSSPYEGVQSFPVDTQWVKTVRHRSYPDRVQVEIVTREPYLSAFKVNPNRDGLVVQVGPSRQADMPAYATDRPIPRSVPRSGERSTAPVDHTKPAAVNQIEFASQEAGKSTLVIGTTRPVQYDIDEADGRTLKLNLLNTRLPKDRQRPLITDHFESAVDRILPAQPRPDTAVFEIELREAVPYFVEQEGGTLRVNLEASSISPKPMVGIPAARAKASPTPPPQAMEESTPDSDTEPPIDTPPSGDSYASTPSTPSEESPAGLDTELEITESGPQYTGEKIALDFYETDIKNVFRILREVSGMNFAIDRDVTGQVTLTLAQPVPWDQVLDLILKMNKLGKAVEGNIIRIATRETLDQEERIRQEKQSAELALRDQQKQLEPLTTEYLPVNYSNAQREIMPHIEKILTRDRGSVSVDERTNVVIYTDTAEKIEQARDLIRKLDRVTPQVIIEARVVEATTNFSREIGTTWEMGLGVQEVGGDGVIDVGGTTDTVQDSVNNRVGTGPERGYNDIGGTYGYNMAMNFPLAAENFGSIGFNFVRIAGTPLLLNAKLQAMESQGEGKIISAPKVVTLDNKKAVIKQGISYPYQTVEDGEVNVEFKDVDLLLEVVPHVTPDNRISMNINITKNDLGNVIAGQQSFTTKEAQTELLINDGDTVVIGGIIKTTERNEMTGIPGLSKIPILGWFFKTQGKSRDKEELLIFITPRIVQLEQRTVQF
ncbi:MAG: type IV pilus secretin PilQ [Thermodesulfobacteriota bacterium]